MPRKELDRLIALLREDGRRVVGPHGPRLGHRLRRDRYDGDLPTGITDVQAPGRYRIEQDTNGSSGKSFDFASSPTSWKSYTYPRLGAHRASHS